MRLYPVTRRLVEACLTQLVRVESHDFAGARDIHDEIWLECSLFGVDAMAVVGIGPWRPWHSEVPGEWSAHWSISYKDRSKVDDGSFERSFGHGRVSVDIEAVVDAVRKALFL